ncbi:MAG: hypothetical protein WA821_16755 [Anaerolineales bacterium]
MKRNLYIALAALVVFVLTACQATPATPTLTRTSGNEFFQDQPGRWISVRPPAGWVAKPGGSNISPTIILTDDWKGYQQSDGKAIGITILPLADKGSAEQVLQIAIGRLKGSLAQPAGEVKLEQVGNQSYASVEYNGLSVEAGGESAYYFLAVVATDQRSVLVFISTTMPDQQEHIRSAFQKAVKAITLH